MVVYFALLMLIVYCIWFFINQNQIKKTTKEKLDQIPDIFKDVEKTFQERKEQLVREKQSLEKDEEKFKQVAKKVKKKASELLDDSKFLDDKFIEESIKNDTNDDY